MTKGTYLFYSAEKIQPLTDVFKEFTRGYTNLGSDYSVSDLINAPRIVQLNRRHKGEIQTKPFDLNALLGSFRGTAIHTAFEWQLNKIIGRREGKSPYLVERRIWDRICDRKISGKFDILYNEDLFDLKTTSVWKRIFEGFADWESAQNLYAYLLSTVGVQVRSLNIIAWYTDWQKEKADGKNQGYPPHMVEGILLPLWSLEEQQAYLEERIEFHKLNEQRPDNELSPCSEKEMWAKPTTFAVKQVGKDRALRVLNSQAEAANYIRDKKVTGASIEVRPGIRTRCLNWCDANAYCNIHQQYIFGTGGAAL